VNALGLIVGGPLLMAGAALPWLTLFAGLHPYGGLIGPYGWGIFAAGAVALASGFAILRARPPWAGWASAIMGCAVLVFAVWLLAGLEQIIHRPSAMMLVPRAGPGLFVVLSGAAIIVLASLPSTALQALHLLRRTAKERGFSNEGLL
jgi:hypothetical protein